LKRGEIYTVALDPTQGREQQGTRPVIVISSDAFNRLTRLPVILPITNGGAFAQAIGFAVPLSGTGVRTTGIIRCDQPRILDLQASGARLIERLAGPALDDVLARTLGIFQKV